ncbi:hypothetical protein [Chondromyces crocatus]|uniref:Uncharacterized protein n=1 Tax=Chondromyces crocatus TaxID=52 RepID=A0A0K1EGR9_CHOCO|nr:hypothetical protein [Chondromyces crocatus]AKT39788.1 uncharacterized protein CMC5_039390 [Chondromyces crocatus]
MTNDQADPSDARKPTSASAEGHRGPAPSDGPTGPSFVARWDLDKTYLRTDFDTLRDLLRTAVERPDQKRTVPGAAALLRELGRAGVETHILSGSPDQLRSRIEQKLRLDGVRWATLTLKPNLQNILRLRFRALRGQLGYKLPALLRGRCELVAQRDTSGALVHEVLLGDDAEADAFVYSLYADVSAGAVSPEELTAIMRLGHAYEDTILDALRYASYVEKGPVVERILIHLDRQSSPSDFRVFGSRVVPFYNYLQAALVLHEAGRLSPQAVLRVAQDLVVAHNFDGAALARSYLDLSRRGHVSGQGIPAIVTAYEELMQRRIGGASDLRAMVAELQRMALELRPPVSRPSERVDYQALAALHNPRVRRKRR